MDNPSLGYALAWWLQPLVDITIGVLAARVDRWFAARAHRKSSADLSELLADPELLTAHNFQTLIHFCKFVAMLLLLFALRISVDMTWLSRGRFDRSDTTLLSHVAPVVYMGMWFSCLWFGVKASYYSTVSWDTYQALRQRVKPN